MQKSFRRPFVKFVKKAQKPLKLAISDAVEDICDQPSIGEMKKGDLAGLQVHKFWFQKCQYLIAYRVDLETESLVVLAVDFYQIGTHENFYDNLKLYLRTLD